MPLKSSLAKLLDQLPYVSSLRKEVTKAGTFGAGHYSSPIPSIQEVERQLQATSSGQPDSLADIDLNAPGQRKRLERWIRFSKEMQFPKTATEGFRYWFEQEWFSYADATFLYCFLREQNPRNVIEVGSGFSSALMLDTAERCFEEAPKFTFIEPTADRLEQLLKGSDCLSVRIRKDVVQNTPLEEFEALLPGDLLFIDSSHVIKFGNDLHFLFTRVLPLLPVGCFVCFHDI